MVVPGDGEVHVTVRTYVPGPFGAMVACLADNTGVRDRHVCPMAGVELHVQSVRLEIQLNVT